MGILRAARNSLSALGDRFVNTTDKAKPSDGSESDLYFVGLAQKGDKQAFRQLFERYQSRVLALAISILKYREDAEDVVQEAFVKAYISLRDFKGESSFYSWLYRITHNIAIDHLRRVKRRGGENLEYSEENLGIGNKPIEEISNSFVQPAVSASPLERLEQKERAGKLQSILNQLSEEHRTAIILREVDGLSYDEIAEVTGTARGTVMSRLFYARKKIQEGFEDD